MPAKSLIEGGYLNASRIPIVAALFEETRKESFTGILDDGDHSFVSSLVRSELTGR
jgi:hypothetical protein